MKLTNCYPLLIAGRVDGDLAEDRHLPVAMGSRRGCHRHPWRRCHAPETRTTTPPPSL